MTEVVSTRQVQAVCQRAHLLQVGSRNVRDWLWSGLAALVVGACAPAGSASMVRSLALTVPGAHGRQDTTFFRRAERLEKVKVGLLVSSTSGVSEEARHGAELAVAHANGRGGIDGRAVELIVRAVEGPWGSGSKEIVSLVFDERVWAILGSLDGRSAHLAEQVVTKGQVAMISLWASDPTLTQINVPWFFRCVPDDRQQARALLRAISRSLRHPRVATVAADTYDARMGASTFAEVAQAAGHPVSGRFVYRDTAADLRAVLRWIQREEVEVLVLFGPPSSNAALARLLRGEGMKHSLFGPLSAVDEAVIAEAGSGFEGAVVVAPGHWVTPIGRTFQQEFQDVYGYRPGAIAAYAYDGMSVIIAAIERGGLDRQRIRDALADLRHPRGVTGPIEFDARGNRSGSVRLVKIIGGRPQLLIGG